MFDRDDRRHQLRQRTRPGGSDSGSSSAQIAAWVEANFESTTLHPVTIYDPSAD
ncbi:hypothetical protein [Brevibacterium siliguriense]|uniref:hypothetical protein n=1 Tax=Brevibacterium siliguriense TaxID=1136497 RepID=UPI0012FE16A9|nr:hypothetical protein [Brevibacterium siliguriense]